MRGGWLRLGARAGSASRPWVVSAPPGWSGGVRHDVTPAGRGGWPDGDGRAGAGARRRTDGAASDRHAGTLGQRPQRHAALPQNAPAGVVRPQFSQTRAGPAVISTASSIRPRWMTSRSQMSASAASASLDHQAQQVAEEDLGRGRRDQQGTRQDQRDDRTADRPEALVRSRTGAR